MQNESEIAALTKELRALTLRTSELAERLAALADSPDSSGGTRPTGTTSRGTTEATRRDRNVRNGLLVGDRVRFRRTRVTSGGIGTITGFTATKTLIRPDGRRASSTPIYRNPENVERIHTE